MEFSQPMGAMIELTSLCDLKCLHCYNASGEKHLDDLADLEWHEIMSKILSHNMTTILFTGGEPLLRRQLLLDLIQRISSRPEIKIVVNSNGQNIDEDFLEKLAGCPNEKMIQISIDGAYPDLHEAVRRVPGSWKKAIDACLLISRYSIELRLAHTINKVNIDSIEHMIMLALFVGANLLGLSPTVPLGRGRDEGSELILPYSDRLNVNKTIEGLKEKYKSVLKIEHTLAGGKEYYQWYKSYYQDWLIIDPTGNIKLENRLPFIVGSVVSESIPEIWEKVNHYQKSKYVQEKIDEFIFKNIEVDNLDYIYLHKEKGG